MPDTEVCDDVDNDCDGALDEGGDEGQPAAGNGKEPRRKPAEMAAFMGRRGT